ncbi:toxin secretion, membrane fusion protein [Sphaerospermopsis torques-reginae]|uniref:Toxin secretion, membrane fusion protein n=1 Tax=Sphaerospermopsis torques-reginae ITEP-024 TaxID=984208 RepID=A0ABX8WWN0_9CYAN|nr:toxin secretion, membrane fusion protein [Sphaerospermopsis torques-reginae]QYX30842.1 toxin secretion, membrane fusion protein [Sphaerospermopsis torques-reginae ITEP-024]
MEKVVTKVNQKQQKSDFYYWQKQSYQKRLEALEQIRREYHQYQYHVEPRFQRVYTIIKR